MTKIEDIKEFNTLIINNLRRRFNIKYIEEIKDKPRNYFEHSTGLGKLSINIIMDYITDKFYHNLYIYE